MFAPIFFYPGLRHIIAIENTHNSYRQVVAAVTAQGSGSAYKLKMNFGGETFVHGGPDASFKPLISCVGGGMQSAAPRRD